MNGQMRILWQYGVGLINDQRRKNNGIVCVRFGLWVGSSER